jgi:uncharacterized protein YwqG
LKKICKKVKHLKRKALVPHTKSGDGKITDFKFGGKPYLEEGEEWPKCTNCKGNPMLFFLQVCFFGFFKAIMCFKKLV